MGRNAILAAVTTALAMVMGMNVLGAAPKSGPYPGWYFDNESLKWVNKGNWAQDDIGWWYDLGDGTWLKNGKHTIDGDCDGITERYYFNQDGYMMMDYTAENGDYYNSDGHFVYYGVVDTSQILIPDPEADYNSDNGGYNSYGCSNAALDMIRSTREENKKYVEVGELNQNVAMTVVYANGFSVSYPYQGTGVSKKLSVTHTRADLDGTHLFKYYDGSLTVEQFGKHLQNKGWVFGLSGRYVVWNGNGGYCSFSASPEGIGAFQYGGGVHGDSLALITTSFTYENRP